MSREKANKVKGDHVVVLRFTARDDDGRVLDEASEADPFVYLHGHGAVLEALEEALADREVGETFEVTLRGEDAFGRPREEPERTIPRDAISTEGELPAGFPITLCEDGVDVAAWVVEERGRHLVVSLAHPLAADPAHLEIEVLKVRPASPRELEDGFSASITGKEDPGEAAPPRADRE